MSALATRQGFTFEEVLAYVLAEPKLLAETCRLLDLPPPPKNAMEKLIDDATGVTERRARGILEFAFRNVWLRFPPAPGEDTSAFDAEFARNLEQIQSSPPTSGGDNPKETS